MFNIYFFTRHHLVYSVLNIIEHHVCNFILNWFNEFISLDFVTLATFLTILKSFRIIYIIYLLKIILPFNILQCNKLYFTIFSLYFNKISIKLVKFSMLPVSINIHLPFMTLWCLSASLTQLQFTLLLSLSLSTILLKQQLQRKQWMGAKFRSNCQMHKPLTEATPPHTTSPPPALHSNNK